MTNTAVVVGGGVIGLTTALELRRRGLGVILLERDRVGAGASSAAGGILSPLQPWRSEPALAGLWALSLSRYRTLFDEMRDEEPENAVEPTTPGLLCIIAREASAARAWIETGIEAGAEGQRLIELDADALAREEPALDADAGFLLPDVRRIDPPALLGALTRMAERRGVRIREHCAVREIKMKGGGGKAQTKGVETDAGFVAADVVVVCAGAWLSALLPEAFARPQVRPVRGQIIEYAAEPGLLRHVVSHQAPASSRTPGAEMENYLIPCADGRILAGSTLEDCGFDDSITDTARDALALAAERVLPALARCSIVRQWAGLRPDAGRKTPVICAHPQIAGLFVNGGHYRNGIALAAGSALLAAQLVCEEETAMDAKPLSFGGGFGGGFAS